LDARECLCIRRQYAPEDYGYAVRDYLPDESIARWYGQGGHWIDLGFPHYFSIDRKPENGFEVQSAACGRSRIMLNIRLVTTGEDEARGLRRLATLSLDVEEKFYLDSFSPG
jgi:hypothetical protein